MADIIYPDIEEWDLAALRRESREDGIPHYQSMLASDLHWAHTGLNAAVRRAEWLGADPHLLDLARKQILLFMRLREVAVDNRYALTREELAELESPQLEMFD